MEIGGIAPSIAAAGARDLLQFTPEPRHSPGLGFSSVMTGLGQAAKIGLSAFPGVNLEYVDLLNKQIEVQQQMQLVSLHSNIEKSRHETQMAAVRNIRTG